MASSLCRRGFLKYTNNLFHLPHRTGYIVLLPEISELPENEELSTSGRTPEFHTFTTEKFRSLMTHQTTNCHSRISQVEERLKEAFENEEKLDIFRDVLDPLEAAIVPLDNTWGVMKALFLANQQLLPKSFYMPFHKHATRVRAQRFNIEEIFKNCKAAAEKNFESYTEEEKRLINKFILEGSLNGLQLSTIKKTSLHYYNAEISKHQKAMETKLESFKDLFRMAIGDSSVVESFPIDLLKKIASNPEEPTKGPWQVNLLPHVTSLFLEYCSDRNMRLAVYDAHVKQGSTIYGKEQCIGKDVQYIRIHRRRVAKSLGFNSYFHMSLKTKMAKSVEDIQCTLSELLSYAKPAQEKQVYELELYANENGFSGNVELWDLPYWRRKHMEHLFEFDEQALKAYFPLPQVLLGLFALCEQLFSIDIEEDQTLGKYWHSDVRFYKVLDAETKAYIGSFYLDPYARPGKVSATTEPGWMVGMRSKSEICNSLPLASLIFNFDPPTTEKPSLLAFREVQLLFKRFGHLLQHLLTTARYSEVSGLSNVEWDAVGICRDFLELWLYERGTLESISGHYESGDPLPNSFLFNLPNVRQYMAGYDLCREIYFSNLDIELHIGSVYYLNVIQNLWKEHFIFDLYENDSHPSIFTELFCKDWGAAYYSHLWSKMIAADIYMAFAEVGFQNQQALSALGKKFRSTFLSLGGGEHPGKIFQSFRGRDPSVESLVLLLGMKKYQRMLKEGVDEKTSEKTSENTSEKTS